MGCDTDQQDNLIQRFQFQSTHPRGVRLGIMLRKIWRHGHFNPRTHVGCDSITLFCLLLAQNFNPRTHVGCDGGQTPQTPSRGNFNPRTHVGCDIPSTQVSERDTVFQSTHPRGVRQLARLTSIVTKNFNPRTHVGCDGCWRRRRPPTRYFNPRTHVGCDLGHQPDYIAAVGISIHAPTWGATRQQALARRQSLISIHAPTWGATVRRGLPCH